MISLTDNANEQFMRTIIETLVQHKSLSSDEMNQTIQLMMSGQMSDIFMTSFLTAMRMKGETVDEMSAAADVMLSLADPVVCHDANAIDIVGTGGDNFSLFNVSTGAALICSAAGVTVAKHGNRSFSSASGSADVLESAGVNLKLKPDQLSQCLLKHQLCFMFAPNHHASMGHASKIRKELGMRTFMNLLGPLVNPARISRQLIGVYDARCSDLVAQVFAKMGGKQVVVVHSEEGLDEVSPVLPTALVEYKEGQYRHDILDPKTIGIQHDDLSGLQVNNAAESWCLLQKALSGGVVDQPTQKARDMLALNAGVALYVAGKVAHWMLGVKEAQQIIQSGLVLKKFNNFVGFTQTFNPY